MEWVAWTLSAGVECQERKSDHLLVSSAKVNGGCTSTSYDVVFNYVQEYFYFLA
jgi:hypothetical protein